MLIQIHLRALNLGGSYSGELNWATRTPDAATFSRPIIIVNTARLMATLIGQLQNYLRSCWESLHFVRDIPIRLLAAQNDAGLIKIVRVYVSNAMQFCLAIPSVPLMLAVICNTSAITAND